MTTLATSFHRAFLFMALPAALAFTSCNDDDDNIAAPTEGRVMVTHAAPYNNAEVDVLVNGDKKEDVEYGDETDYFGVTPGQQTFQVRVKSTQAQLLSSPLTIEASKNYSVFVYNPTATQGALLQLTDDLTAPAAGKAHIRFVNLGYDAPNVTLTTQGAGATPLATNIAKLGNSGFVPVDARSNVVLEVREAANGQATLLNKTVTLTAGKIYNVVLYGINSPTAPAATALALEVEDLN